MLTLTAMTMGRPYPTATTHRQRLPEPLPRPAEQGVPSATSRPSRRAGGKQIGGILLALLLAHPATGFAATSSFAPIVQRVQPAVVKVFGAGGLRGLENYQSGFVFRPDGHIITAWSYVLDTEDVTVVLDDGRRFTATLVGADPYSEIAVLKIDATTLSCLPLDEAVSLAAGTRVLAFSNLFGIATGDEPASVLHGVVSGVTTLQARRGAYPTPYEGPVYLLDAMTNNAGAAGGVLTDAQGRLAAVLGKELRDAQANIWINYAIPVGQITSAVENILAGKSVSAPTEPGGPQPAEPVTLSKLGIVLVPDILTRTPAYVETVRVDSPAARAGLRPDDLILFVGPQMVQSQAELVAELSHIDIVDEVPLTIMRSDELLQVTLVPEL
jgi:serine protease Do